MLGRIEGGTSIDGRLFVNDSDGISIIGFLSSSGYMHRLDIVPINSELSNGRVELMSAYKDRKTMVHIKPLSADEFAVSVYIYSLSEKELETAFSFRSNPKLLPGFQPE